MQLWHSILFEKGSYIERQMHNIIWKKWSIYYSKDRVKHDSFRVFNAFVTRFSCVCMKRVLKRVDSRFSRYKRVSQQPIKSALQ